MKDAMVKSKQLCSGCTEDFYNPGCWSYESAKVCKRAFVHVSMVPPWSVKPLFTLSCHHKKSHIAVKPGHPSLTSDKNHVQERDGGNYE